MPDPSLDTIRFRCISCSAPLKSPTRNVGTRQHCPKCKASLIVPSPEEPIQIEDEEYELWEGTDQPDASDKWAYGPFITFQCHICSTLLHADVHQANQPLACPDCGHLNRVPSTQTQQTHKPHRTPPPPRDDSLGLEPPAATATLSPLLTTRSVESAATLFPETRPERLQWPFVSGVFTFPFGNRVLPSILGFSAVGTGAAWGLAVLATTHPAFAMFGSVLVITFYLACLSAFLMAICTDTATGNRTLVSWPEGGPVDWLFRLAYVGMSCLIAGLPGAALEYFVEPDFQIATSLVSFWLLFPLFFLSALETDLFVGVFSGPVWRSVGTHFRFWGIFYLESLALAGVVFLVFHRLLESGAPAIFVSELVSITTLVIYFRLLGRLAWVSAQD